MNEMLSSYLASREIKVSPSEALSTSRTIDALAYKTIRRRYYVLDYKTDNRKSPLRSFGQP